MKRVSFKVASALKKAGYNLKELDYTLCALDETETECVIDNITYERPYYVQVWLWLWRVKHIAVEADYSCANDDWFDGGICGKKFNDPEDTIIAALEYLIENNLIK